MERKKVLITGATAGIGKASAALFAQNNYDLIITGRRAERLAELKSELETAHGVNVLTLCFDVQDKAAVEQHLGGLSAEWQAIDVLVNNAGLAVGKDPFQECEVDDWERMIDTNVKGLLYVSRVIAPMMIAQGKGHVINVSSTAGKQVYAGGNVYCATKHAVDALSRAMRIDMLKHGIKVTSVMPGLVDTEFSVVRFKGDEDKAESVYANYQPLVAEDIADAIYYAASRPLHVNINEIMLTPQAQADSFHLHKS